MRSLSCRKSNAARLRAVALLAAASALAACAAVRRPSLSVAQLQQDAVRLNTADLTMRDSVLTRLVRRAERRGDLTLDILLLSGGGQNGAFGTGFLRGWFSRADEPMPRFDLVSGVSTGALQAPYVLLGTKAALDSVSALYARAATTIAPTLDWWFWLRRTGGLVNTERFDRTLERTIDGRFRDELRAAFADDRQLVFSTTDYDLGIGRVWSLGDELDSTPAGLLRARTLLKGATAIPGIFPPVVVDNHLHGDGGIIENVLPVLGFADYQELGRRLAAKGLGNITVRVWVVMNIWTHAQPRVIAASSRGEISNRSTSVLFYAHQPSTLHALQLLSRAVQEQVPGVNLEVRIAELPSAESLSPGADKLFEKRFMQRLDSIGFAKSRSASPWDRITSAYQRPIAPPQ